MNETEIGRNRKQQPNIVPADDEWFDLEVDGEVNPMDVIVSAGHDIENWKFLGPEFSGKRMIRAKLVRLGCVRNLKEGKKKADKAGYRLAGGQAIESFKTKFPLSDDKGPIVFGGSQWQRKGPNDIPYAAYLLSFKGGWRVHLHWSDVDLHDGWRWLVAK